MSGFCPECGQSLAAGRCPSGHMVPGSPLPPDNRESPQVTAEISSSRPSERMVALPKASTPRRLLGSGIEFLVYTIALIIIFISSPLLSAIPGVVGPLLLIAMILARDAKAGAWSIAKRVGCMRVIDRETRRPPSFKKAILRNSYYLVLLLLMIPPMFEYVFGLLFEIMILVDILTIITNPKGRRLGDVLAGTQVVQVRE